MCVWVGGGGGGGWGEEGDCKGVGYGVGSEIRKMSSISRQLKLPMEW